MREAIQHLGGSTRYALIVLDLMLPTIGGEKVIEFLRGHTPESVRRIVIVTAATRLATFDLPEELCVVLRKPFELHDFVSAVRTCAE